MKSNILKLICNPSFILMCLSRKMQIDMNDELFLKMLYKYEVNKNLNLENPKTFNEKLQWLKLHDRKDIYTTMVDKSEVKKYVADKIGEEYIIPTIGVYDKFEDIDFENLPNQFVIKCTHNSGGLVICKNKNILNIEKTEKKIKKCLKKNYYYTGREWPYKNVKPRIIIEKYIEETKSEKLKDYKLFCFNGEPKYTLVCSNRNNKFKNTDFFDNNWKKMTFTREKYENNPKGIDKPKNFETMLQISKKLAKDTPFVRVDLYNCDGKIYFGELTFYPSSGVEGFRPDIWDDKLGELLNINKV